VSQVGPKKEVKHKFHDVANLFEKHSSAEGKGFSELRCLSQEWKEIFHKAEISPQELQDTGHVDHLMIAINHYAPEKKELSEMTETEKQSLIDHLEISMQMRRVLLKKDTAEPTHTH